MTCSLAWNRKDEVGKKFQIEFQLIREKPIWKAKRERFAPKEEYNPDEEDWDTLIAQMEKNLQRGKLYPEDLVLIKRLAENL